MNDSDSDNEMPSEQPRHTTSSAARRRRRSNARQAWFTQQQNYQNSSSTTTDSEPTNSNSDSASSSSSRGRRHSDRSRNSSSTRSTTRNESQFMSESRTRGIISSIQRTQITELQPGTDVNAWRLSAENAVRLAGAHYALYTSHESAQQLHVNEVLLALIRKSVAPHAGASLVAERATTAKEAWKHILDVIMPDTPRAETALWTELRAVSQGSESWETFAGHVMSVHAKILHFYQRRALVKMDDSVIINEDKAVSEISKARKLAEQQASATMPEQALIQILIAGTCIYRKVYDDGHWTASASVVDDLKPLSTRPCDSIKTNADATVTSPSHLDEYFAAMSKHIKLTRNDNDTFIGIHTEQTADGFALTQQGYIISNAERLAPPNIRATTPVISTREIQRAPGPPHQDDVSFCQAAAGSMIYLPTRPDILAARRIVSTLATMASPDVVQAAQQCWAYLRDTAERGTRSFPEEADGQLYVYADCHRGIHETLVMYLIILNAVVIDCAVNRVHLHSSSSGEGEMHAVHKPINKVIHHRNLLTELGIQQHGPTKIFCDAKVVADVIIKDGPHQRLAHVGAKVVRVRETQRDGIIEIEQVPRELQLADILGKPRGPSEFTPMRDVIVPPAGVLTDAQITHRLRYPHVSHSRRNVELAQQKRSNN